MLSSAAKAAAVSFVLFAAHRALAWGALASGTSLHGWAFAGTVLVGLLSDLWVAYLVGALTLAFGAVASLIGQPRIARQSWLVLTGLLALAVAGHQGYVEFFHFQIIPFHLRYLFDPEFVAANGSSVLNVGAVVVVVLWLALAIWLSGVDWRLTRRHALATVAVSVLALIAHNRNIHWRVQWFVPEHLQVNLVERFYLSLKTLRVPPPLTADDWRELQAALGVTAASPPPPATPEAVQQVITVNARDEASVGPIATKLHDAFAARRAAGRKPLALVILLESLRPSETGYFAPDKQSLTPTLDSVHAHGITFTRALSTGSVTRGAQEAIFCGYLGSRDTSLMRGGAVARVDCLPDDIKRQSATGGPKGDVFWFHGGEGRFDGQLEFWRTRGVGQLISLEDFPSDAPRTGWGVSDRTFFERAAGAIAKLRQDSTADYQLGMLLSVTNHIPWDLPRDATVSPAANGELAHPSYYTTAYTDAAVGELLGGLRSTGVWQDALIVIASDHGNNVPPYADLYGKSPTRDTWLQSHVNLLLTGGLVDETLAAIGQPSVTIDRLVSQTDIATTLAAVAGVDARLMGESLFAEHRSLPVLADLEEGVFDPVDERLFRRSEVVGVALRTLSPGERKAMLYYRAFLQYINSWSGDTQG